MAVENTPSPRMKFTRLVGLSHVLGVASTCLLYRALLCVLTEWKKPHISQKVNWHYGMRKCKRNLDKVVV